jgi:hypothetical protein
VTTAAGAAAAVTVATTPLQSPQPPPTTTSAPAAAASAAAIPALDVDATSVIAPGDRILEQYKCLRVTPFFQTEGTLLIGTDNVYFNEDPEIAPPTKPGTSAPLRTHQENRCVCVC